MAIGEREEEEITEEEGEDEDDVSEEGGVGDGDGVVEEKRRTGWIEWKRLEGSELKRRQEEDGKERETDEEKQLTNNERTDEQTSVECAGRLNMMREREGMRANERESV